MIDSTGIKVEGEGEWNAFKHDCTKRRAWRKIHRIGEQPQEIPAAEFTPALWATRPMLELIDQIPPDQEIAGVTADGTFDARKCQDAVATRGAAAIIPPPRKGRPWKPDAPGAVERNEAYAYRNASAEPISRRWSGYHR